MRDPELVARAGYAAARLEQAWERWRALHGLGGSADPLASYVGYSLKEPMGQPRVVIGVDAAEAEFFADFLESHDCSGLGADSGLAADAGALTGAGLTAGDPRPVNGAMHSPGSGPMHPPGQWTDAPAGRQPPASAGQRPHAPAGQRADAPAGQRPATGPGQRGTASVAGRLPSPGLLVPVRPPRRDHPATVPGPLRPPSAPDRPMARLRGAPARRVPRRPGTRDPEQLRRGGTCRRRRWSGCWTGPIPVPGPTCCPPRSGPSVRPTNCRRPPLRSPGSSRRSRRTGRGTLGLPPHRSQPHRSQPHRTHRARRTATRNTLITCGALVAWARSIPRRGNRCPARRRHRTLWRPSWPAGRRASCRVRPRSNWPAGSRAIRGAGGCADRARPAEPPLHRSTR